ncbi:MAG: phage tail tape measure protein [Oscillospiraceae bacterium]
MPLYSISLALAGYDAEKACGALPTVLNIAAAGGMELANASDMVTDAMSALGIEATSQNLEEFGDKLAKTSQKSNTSVAQLGEAILTVGGTAKNLAGGTTEMNTALGILADNGIKGAEGGTALRNMILALGSPTDNAKKQLDALGVQVYDTEGKMRPLNDIFGDLNSSMANMTDEQKNIALSDIFNKVDLKSSSALLANCGERWNELSGYINDSEGACEDMAETMNDNLKGDITSMQSALEGLKIALSDTLNSDLRTIVQNATGYLAELRNSFLDGGWENLGSAIGKTIKNVINDNRDIVSKYMTLGTRMITAIANGISENSDFITKSLGAMFSQAVTSGSEIYSNVYVVGLKLITGIAESIANNSNKIIDELLNSIGDISGSLLTYTPKLLQAGLTIIQAILQGLSSNNTLTAMTNQMILLINSLATCIKDNLTPILSAGLYVITAIIDGISLNAENLFWSAFNIVSLLCDFILANLSTLVNVAIGIIQSIGQFLSENSFILVTSAMLLINQLGTFIIDNLPVLLNCAIEILNSLISFISDNLSLFINCAVQILLVLANAILENLPILINYIPMLVTSITEAIISNLSILLNVAVQLLMMLVNGIIDNVSVLFDATITILNTLIDMIIENLPMLIDVAIEIVITLMNGILDNLDKLIDASLGLLNQLIDSVIENLPLLIDCALQIVTKLAEEIANNFPVIVEKGGELVQKLIKGILDAKDKAIEGAKELINNIWNIIQNTDWLNLGKNILLGIANGLWEGLSSIGETISSVADNILQSFKNFFGISSPSKLLRDEVGKFMPQGIAVGFENKTPNAIDDINKSLKNGINDIEVDDINRTLNSQITGIDIDGIYSQLKSLNYAQSVPSYSGVVQSAYKSSENPQQNINTQDNKTYVIQNYLFKNSQKLNEFVIKAGTMENARSGGVAI